MELELDSLPKEMGFQLGTPAITRLGPKPFYLPPKHVRVGARQPELLARKKTTTAPYAPYVGKPLTSLPTEILHTIASYVAPTSSSSIRDDYCASNPSFQSVNDSTAALQDLLHLALTCRGLCSICLPIMYRTVILHSQTKLKKLVDTLVDKQAQMQRYVRHIFVYNECRNPHEISPGKDIIRLLDAGAGLLSLRVLAIRYFCESRSQSPSHSGLLFDILSSMPMLPALRRLAVEDYGRVAPEVSPQFQAAATAAAAASQVAVRDLSLVNCQIPAGQTLKAVLDHFPNLRALTVANSDCQLHRVDLEACGKSLDTLVLNGFDLCRDLAALDGLTELKSLELSVESLRFLDSSSSDPSRGPHVIANLPASLKKLETLRIEMLSLPLSCHGDHTLPPAQRPCGEKRLQQLKALLLALEARQQADFQNLRLVQILKLAHWFLCSRETLDKVRVLMAEVKARLLARGVVLEACDFRFEDASTQDQQWLVEQYHIVEDMGFSAIMSFDFYTSFNIFTDGESGESGTEDSDSDDEPETDTEQQPPELEPVNADDTGSIPT